MMMKNKCPKGKMEFGRKCVNPGSPIEYKESDFKILKGLKETFDKRIAYEFKSKDGEVDANFFWESDDVQMRAMVGDCGDIGRVGFPFANPYGTGILPKPEVPLRSLIRILKQKKYKETKCK